MSEKTGRLRSRGRGGIGLQGCLRKEKIKGRINWHITTRDGTELLSSRGQTVSSSVPARAANLIGKE